MRPKRIRSSLCKGQKSGRTMKRFLRNINYYGYRFSDFLVRAYRFTALKWLRAAKSLSGAISLQKLKVRIRAARRSGFKFLRALVFFMWRLWVRKIEGLENIPENEPVIIVSNHQSYFDFFILASVLRRQTVFVAVKGLSERPFVGWFMKLDTIVYVDRDKPGLSFFKELIRHLDAGKQIVLYPEGLRSRSGKMLPPKTGFLKLALKQNVPILPVVMKGTYEILPPNKHIPAFKRCDVIFGKKMYISPSTPLFKDVFLEGPKNGRYSNLNDEQLNMVAYRVMDIVRQLSGQAWDETAQGNAEKFCAKDQLALTP